MLDVVAPEKREVREASAGTTDWARRSRRGAIPPRLPAKVGVTAELLPA